MNQQELEALLRQIAPNNDPRRLEFSEGTEQVEVEERPKDPATGAEQTWADPVKRKVPVRTMTWVDRGTGQTLKVQVDPTTGTYTKTFQGTDPKVQGEPATTPAQVAKDEQGVPAGSRQETDSSGKTVKVTTYKRPDGTTYEITESVQAAPEKPQVAPGTLNTTSPQYAVVNPDGSVSWKTNPNYRNPSPKPLDIPNTRTIIWDNGDGTTKTEKNPAYVKPSKIMPHPSDPTKMVNVTEDDNGNPVILPVDDKTVIKPADLPVLQAKYGQIAQGLGALAQDLNSRYARGEITEKQKNDAFTAAHQQAQTQVSEINSILDTSKAIWSGELTQRGQSLAETQSRRSYAGGIFDRAAATGMGIATSAGPGHGREIAAGVGALMNIGQQYAQGMGGFKESPEIPLPAALQQARGISLPGYGPAEAAPPGAPPPPSGGPGAAPGGLPAPLLRPPPPVTGSVAPPPRLRSGQAEPPPFQDPGFVRDPAAIPGMPTDPGFSRDPAAIPGMPTDPGFTRGTPAGLQGMGQLLQGAQGYAGAPVAAGGAGLWDPTNDVQSMIGDGSDQTWAEAVRAAAATVSQPGYAWSRFTQPASRFG